MAGGPIFIGGLSSSGKTPLRLMLSAHPNIVMTRRTKMWPRYYARYGDLRHPANLDRCLTAMLQSKYVQVLQPDVERIRREFRQGPSTYGRLFALFHEHHAERQGKPRWGDQLGFVERYVEPIFAAYPSAKMIHMIRHPRGRHEHFERPTRVRSGSLGWDLARWIHSVRLGERNTRKYPDRYRVVRYETLAARPKETLHEICAFLGETFVTEMLTVEVAMSLESKFFDAHQESPLHDTSDSSLAREAPSAFSAGAVAFTQAYARSELLHWGYSLETVRFSIQDRLRVYAIEWPANLAGLLAWRTLEATPFAQH